MFRCIMHFETIKQDQELHMFVQGQESQQYTHALTSNPLPLP